MSHIESKRVRERESERERGVPAISPGRTPTAPGAEDDNEEEDDEEDESPSDSESFWRSVCEKLPESLLKAPVERRRMCFFTPLVKLADRRRDFLSPAL